MSIVITLNPKLEALFHSRATKQGQDVDLIVSELLASILDWEEKDSEEAIKGIQTGLDDFASGRYQSFQDFSEEHRYIYNLPANS
jgi:hypothetical protein